MNMSPPTRKGLWPGSARATRFVAFGPALLSGVLLLTGCSFFQSANGACASVQEVVNSLPPADRSDTGVEIMPRIDEELDAAREAQRVFADADVPADFQEAWTRMIGALEENRTTWQDVTPWKGVPGTQMIGVLRLSDAKSKGDEAKNSLNAAADKHGFANCGSAINWQY